MSESNVPPKPGQEDITAVVSSMWINAIIGGACVIGFFTLRTFMPQYQLRLHTPAVTVPPPALPQKGRLQKIFGWILPVITTSDAFILRSAGLDALVLQKANGIMMQIMGFMMFIGLVVLLPLHTHAPVRPGDISFTRLTMANLPVGSPLMWIHLFMVLLCLAVIFLLLEWHTRQYCSLRQQYIRGLDAPNTWRDLHMAEADGVMRTLADGRVAHREANKLLALAGEVDYEAELAAIDEDQDQRSARLHWWQRVMLYLTSWVGEEKIEQAAMHRTNTMRDKAGGLIAEDIAQGDYLRDAALGELTSSTPPAGSKPRGDAGPAPFEVATPANGDKDVAASTAIELGGLEESSGSGEDGIGKMKKCTSQEYLSNVELLQGEDERTVTSKWFTTVDYVATAGGGIRRVQACELTDDTKRLLLSKPSVRYRKTINTSTAKGRRVAVNAQQYAVLVTNVVAPCYPEYANRMDVRLEGGGVETRPMALGAGCCGNPSTGVLYDIEAAAPHGAPAQRCSSHTAAIDSRPDSMVSAASHAPSMMSATSNPGWSDSRSPSPGASGGGSPSPGHLTMVAPTAAAMTAGAGAAAAGTEAAVERVHPRRSGAQLWALARHFMVTGQLKALYISAKYSIVAHVFHKCFPYDFDRVVPVFNFREVDLLMRRWDHTCHRLEMAQLRATTSGKRPMIKVKGSKEKVDAIEWLTLEEQRLKKVVLDARDRALQFNATQSWFVLFKSQKAAAMAASCTIHPLNHAMFQVHPAPGPEEVNWQALWFTHAQRTLRMWLVAPVMVVVVLLPVSLLGAAATQVTGLICGPAEAPNTDPAVNWFCQPSSKIVELIRSLLLGFLPSLLVTLWQGMALPRLIYLCAQSEMRHYSLSLTDRRMAAIYFMWNVFNFFVQGVLGGTAAQIGQLIQDLQATQDIGRLATYIGNLLPGSSKFFLIYIIMRCFMTVPLRFLITQPGVWQSWLRLCDLFSGKTTERITAMRMAIRSPRHGAEFGNLTLIALVGFAFAAINPVILPFCFLFYAGMWLFWRYQLIYNYQRKYESGGLMWPFLVNRILVSAAIMIAFTGLVLSVRQAFAQALLLWVVGLMFTLAYYQRNVNRYQINIREMPLLVALQAPRARVPATVYVPPPLQEKGQAWYPEFNKVWEWFGMPGYSF